MAYADKVYEKLVKDILVNGSWDKGQKVRTKYADGTPAYTKSIFGYQVEFPKDVDPILTSKFVGTKTAFKEIYLFWVKQTTKAEDFEELNVPIWREWYKEIDGELGIGRSYGYQLKKSNQVSRLLFNLERFPFSRRHLVSYWNEEDRLKKSLQECAWAMQFNVVEVDGQKQLDMILIQRSVDSVLGLPYNWTQYRALQKMIAHSSFMIPGRFIHQMGNVHYYDRHEEKILDQIRQPVTLEEPEIIIPNKSFFKYEPDDISIRNYHHNGRYKYEVAI